MASIGIPQKATDKIDHKHLNRWVKDRICAEGMDYLKELAEVLLPDGVGTTQIKIITANHPGDIKPCFTDLFNEWGQRVINPTWQKLIDALKDTNKHALANDIENSLITPVMLPTQLLQEGANKQVISAVQPQQARLIDQTVEGACVERQLDRSILETLNTKYVTLIGELKMIFEKEEKRYPVSNIIIGLCTADKGNLTYFANIECLRSAKTLDEVFFYIGRECKYFDFTILKTFIDASGCNEAKELMENYIQEIENSLIVGLDLESEYDNTLTEWDKNHTKKLEIICDKKELKIKEVTLIIETLERCLKLPKASVSVKDFKQNCIILICRIPKKVKYYLSNLKIIIHKLKPLSALKIKSLIIDNEMELKIPLDCDTKDVISWTKITKSVDKVTGEMTIESIDKITGEMTIESTEFISSDIEDLFKEPITIREAYLKLLSKLNSILKDYNLSTLKIALIHQSYHPNGIDIGKDLKRKIMKAISTFDLLNDLSDLSFFNWLDTQLMDVLAYACNSKSAIHLIERYKNCVYSKKLKDVLNNMVLSKKYIIDSYMNAVSMKINMDPNKITVGDVVRYCWMVENVIVDLGRGILNISHVREGCVEVTCHMPIHYNFNAYKMALHNRHKFTTINLMYIKIEKHPLIYDPWFSDFEKHSVKEITYTQHEVSAELSHILLDIIPMDNVFKLFYFHKIFTTDDLEVISFTPSEYLKKQILLQYLKLSMWPMICDLLHNIKSMRHIGSHLRDVLKNKLPFHFDKLKLQTDSKCVITLHGTKTIKLGLFDDSTLFNKPRAYHLSKSLLFTGLFQHVRVIFPSEVEKEFHYISGHVVELLSCCHPKLLIKWCENLMASDVHKIKLLPSCGMYKLRKFKNSSAVLKMMSVLWSWSNHSILKCLAKFSEIAINLLEEFGSRLDINSSITQYPFSLPFASMIPYNHSGYTMLTLKCNKMLQFSLQLVYDIQSMMIEKCEITEHALQLLAVQSSPLLLQWMIPKHIVTLINVNVKQHYHYFVTIGITEISIHPNIICYTDCDVKAEIFEEQCKVIKMSRISLSQEQCKVIKMSLKQVVTTT